MKQITQYAGLAFSLILIWTSGGQAAGRPPKSKKVKDRPVVSVGVVNHAQVGRLELREAEGQAAAIFADAGVKIKWTDYAQQRPSDEAGSADSCCDVFIRVLPVSMAIRRNSGANALGESVTAPATEAAAPGGVASVFYDRVHGVSGPQGPFAGQVLGDAMAHEIGHQLLGPGHPAQGIMKGIWTPRDLQLASRGQLRFSPEQAKLLQQVAQALQKNHAVKLALGR